MAVQEQTPYIEHIANGVTTSFALEFEFKDKDHLIVFVDYVEPSACTWSLANGSVVFGTAPADGKIISIQRNTPFRRDTNFQSYDNSLRPATINKDFDWIWYKLQELGVADWILGSRIDALKNYVDDRDDELRAYLMEEIHKQGVALDQLDDYYNYLMQRLAQIAVSRGWDASFVVDGNENQHEINRTTVRSVNTIADLMSLQNPKNDQVVSVKGYYAPTNFALAQPFKGGGVFYYAASLSTVNNGVTMFNGWVRVLSNSTLSTYDAGLVGDISIDGLDSYEKLQALLDAAPESSTISLHGEFITSAELFAKDKKSITIVGNGSLIKADSANWVKTRSEGKYYVYGISYATLDSVTTTSITYNTGIINFIGCGTVVVENTHIYGASIPAYLDDFQMLSFQGGDAGITTWACENVNINGCVIDHVFTWGILGGNITRCNVNNNVIRNCVHQSGISMIMPAASNQDKLNIYSNYIENVGLYGVELENHGTAKPECNVYDNTVVDSLAGVTATNLTNKYQIYGNRFINCYYGAW